MSNHDGIVEGILESYDHRKSLVDTHVRNFFASVSMISKNLIVIFTSVSVIPKKIYHHKCAQFVTLIFWLVQKP